MNKLKSHKTVEQIAKKHRLDASFIQKQLDIGEPIEHEHTKDHDLARDITLQHLDEIPDYYTRLKKMEADAKKHHKKFKDVKEGNLHQWFKGSRSKEGKPGWVNVVTGGTCASDEPGEGTPKCVSSSKRATMTPAERRSAARRKKAADPGQQQKTGAAKPTYVSTDSPRKKMNEETDKKGKSSGKKDACYHKVKARYDVWPSAYASGALVKCRKKGAANWGTKSEAMEEKRYCPLCDKREARSECSYGEKAWDKFSVRDEEYSMARSELQTIHDALKRLEMKVGKGEGNLEAWVQSKITKAADYIDTAADYVNSGEMEEACWTGYKQVGMKKKGKKMVPNCVPANEEVGIEEAVRLPATNGNIISVVFSWRGKTYMNKMFFPQLNMPSRRDVTDQIQKVYPGAMVLQYNIAGLEPGQPLIQVYDPKRSKNYLLNNGTIGEENIEEVAAWQRKEGKNKSGGLNEKGRKSYERENPGSDLKAPSKKVGNPRRKSFCARMSGMKKKLTSAKTANDPNSRINKSLRAWNC